MNIFPYALGFLLLLGCTIVGTVTYVDRQAADLNQRIDLSFHAIDHTSNYARTHNNKQDNRIDSAFYSLENLENYLSQEDIKNNCNTFVPKMGQIVTKDITNDSQAIEFREQYGSIKTVQDTTILEMEVRSYLVEEGCLMHINGLGNDWHPTYYYSSGNI